MQNAALKWAQGLWRFFIGLIYPPRCGVCGDLLPKHPRLEKAIGDGLVCRFEQEMEGVVCPKCQSGVEVPSGTRCTFCGAPVAGKTLSEPVCGGCLDPFRPLFSLFALYLYTGGAARCIKSLKYKNRRMLAEPLGRLLSFELKKAAEVDLVAPVPLHKRRLRKRGFNQAALLLSCAEKDFSFAVDYHLLKRKRETASQAGLSRKGRLRNVKGAFVVPCKEKVKGKRVLLVDDVYTTGATLTACAHALRRAGALAVTAVVLARRDMDGA